VRAVSEWILCEREADGRPVLVEYDAELTDAAFKIAHPLCILLTVNGFESNSNGLPASAANDKLGKLKESLEESLRESGGALAVMIASNGHFGYVAYVSDVAHTASFAASAAAAEVNIAHFGSEVDSDWAGYKVWTLSEDDLEEARRRPKPATR
jgi:Family of unknown function (DUF695)